MESKRKARPEASKSERTHIRVLLVDDQQLVRAGFRALLSMEPDILVVGEADSAAAGLTACDKTRPDVLLVDAMMTEMATAAFIREVREHCPETQVIAMAECAEIQCGVLHPGAAPIHRCLLLEENQAPPVDCLELALLAGARGAVRKTCSREELVQAIRAVAPGKYWMGLTTALRMIDHLQHPNQPEPQPSPPELSTPEGLTRREVEVIRELVAGRSNKQIGRALGISEQSVKNAISRLLAKLNLDGRVQIALYAVRTSLLDRYASLLAEVQ